MQHESLPLFIPILATAYLLTVYGLLKIAERQGSAKSISANNIEKARN
jgi:hypothetical protein